MVHFDAKLTGTVEDVSLADLLQLFHYSRRSVALHVSGLRGGVVVMVRGEIEHAACAELVGEPALSALLAEQLVRVRTAPVEYPIERTVDRSFCVVLIDLIRQRDEESRASPRRSTLPPPDVLQRLEHGLGRWLENRKEVSHAAVIDPRQQHVLACDSPALWSELVRSVLLQTLVAPYFDESFTEIDAFLPKLSAGFEGEDCQTVVTFSGRRYVLGLVPEHGWVAALVFHAARVSPGLSLTHMVGFRQAIIGWAENPADYRLAASMR